MFKAGYIEGLRLKAAEALNDPRLNYDFRQLTAHALLSQVNPNEVSTVKFTFEPGRLADHAYYLQYAGSQMLRESYFVEAERLLERAANLFEYLAIASLGQDSVWAEYMLRAAGCYALSGFQANSLLLSRRLVRYFQESEDEPPGLLQEVALRILTRDIGGLSEVVMDPGESREIVDQRLRDMLETEAVSPRGAVVGIAEAEAGFAGADIVDFLLNGRESSARKALEGLEEAEDLLTDLNEVS